MSNYPEFDMMQLIYERFCIILFPSMIMNLQIVKITCWNLFIDVLWLIFVIQLNLTSFYVFDN